LKTPDLGCAVGFPARGKRGEPIAGRLFFATPFHDSTAVGTWYFETGETPDEATLSDDELDDWIKTRRHRVMYKDASKID